MAQSCECTKATKDILPYINKVLLKVKEKGEGMLKKHDELADINSGKAERAEC